MGEELGVLGIFGVICLYGMLAYAGLRTARRATDRYAKLLATGDAQLEEGNTWGDRIWGVYQGQGDNRLGKILMKVREELRRGG